MPINNPVADFFRCPESLINFTLDGELSPNSSFFQFGQDIRCYGQLSKSPNGIPAGKLADLSRLVISEGPAVKLPFDPAQVVENFRRERYITNGHAKQPLLSSAAIREAYYMVRPFLGIPVRKYLQKFFLRNWESLPFPSWPVDTTVEKMQEALLLLSMKAQGIETMPFIWFWPDGAGSCAIMTHDVETRAGVDFTPDLMAMDAAFGIKSSFQVIPEGPYGVLEDYLDQIRSRGFELAVQDLRHDGNLFSDREEFLLRAPSINWYAHQYGAHGFRAGRMYRNTEWYEALDISYDMSVPNVAHLEAQRGGCCTVFPYFIGQILELPLTTTEDYSLFHVLEDYSIDLWKRQMALIMERHGLISFIVHPDYVKEPKALQVYETLLNYLAQLRKEENLWIALPRDVNQWWRERSQMKLVFRNRGWQIEGPGKERARIAYATFEDNRLAYTFDSSAALSCAGTTQCR